MKKLIYILVILCLLLTGIPNFVYAVSYEDDFNVMDNSALPMGWVSNGTDTTHTINILNNELKITNPDTDKKNMSLTKTLPIAISNRPVIVRYKMKIQKSTGYNLIFPAVFDSTFAAYSNHTQLVGNRPLIFVNGANIVYYPKDIEFGQYLEFGYYLDLPNKKQDIYIKNENEEIMTFKNQDFRHPVNDVKGLQFYFGSNGNLGTNPGEYYLDDVLVCSADGENFEKFKQTFYDLNTSKVDKLGDFKENSKNNTILKVGSTFAIANGKREPINYKNNKVMPILKDNKVFLPLRYTLKTLGGIDTINGNTVVATLNNKTLIFTAESNTYIDNSVSKILASPPFFSEGEFMVPLDEFAEGLKIKKAFDISSELIAIGNNEKILLSGYLANNKLKLEKSFGIYIAGDGSDSNLGTKLNPYKTPKRAKDEIALMKFQSGIPEGGINVYIREGEYKFEKSLSFSGDDSGNEKDKITYMAYPNESVFFTGATDLLGSDFTQVLDTSIANRFYPQVREKIKQINLNALGITNFGKIEIANPHTRENPNSTMLFYEDNEQILARWPNFDYTTIKNVENSGSDNSSPAWYFDESIPKRWVGNESEIYFQGYWFWDWYYDTIKCQKIDPQTNIIKTSDATKTAYGVARGKRYYAFNVLDEIDTPGEWYLDRESGILYYYPVVENFNTKKVSLSVLTSPLINFSNSSNIIIDNINFKNTSGKAMSIMNTSDTLITGCSFYNVGSQVADIQGGENVGFRSCDMYNIGKGGIYYNNVGDRTTLRRSNHFVENCHFAKFNTVCKTYAPAILLETNTVGVRISNNIIQDGSHEGIGISGNDHLIENNEIFDLLKETTDAGAIYGGRDTTSFGIVIKNNIIHNLHDNSGSGGAYAIYFDDRQCGPWVHNNIIYNSTSGVMINGGSYINVKDNIFVSLPHGSIKLADQSNLTKDKSDKTTAGSMWTTYKDVPVSNSHWGAKYPQLENFFQQPNWWSPINNILTGNIVKEAEIKIDTGLGAFNTIMSNITQIDDSIFEDAPNDLFKLKADIGNIKRSDFDKIGVKMNSSRKNLPQIRDFSTISPMQGEKQVDTYKLNLKWNPAVGSSFYNVIVATDPGLSNRVVDVKNLKTTNLVVDKLQCNQTKYYWSVEAVCLSGISLLKHKFNLGGVREFTTTQNANVVKSELFDTIQKANIQKDNAVVGTLPGNYTISQKDKFFLDISQAQEIYDDPSSTQSCVDISRNNLLIAMNTFKMQARIGVVDLNSYILKKENWVCENINELVADGTKVVYTGSGKVGYKFPIPNYGIYRFKLRFTAGTGGWQSIGIRESDPVKPSWGGYGYIVNTNGSFQRFPGGMSFGGSGGTFVSGTTYTVEIGATDTSTNGTNIILKVNGSTRQNYLDTKGYISEEGCLSFYNYGVGAKVEIFPY